MALISVIVDVFGSWNMEVDAVFSSEPAGVFKFLFNILFKFFNVVAH